MSFFGRLRRGVLGISDRAVDFDRRGFASSDPQVREILERNAGGFVQGFNIGIERADPDATGRALDQLDPMPRGFAYEGAAMALTLLDWLLPGRRDRFKRFLAGPGDDHAYMLHVGAGWAYARLPGDINRRLGNYHPLLRWLLLDGFGFHEAFFKPRRYVFDRPRRPDWSGYAVHAFDQGIGRALWFAGCGSVDRIAELLKAFSPDRHNDVLGGIGLAAAYAGGVEAGEIRRLADRFPDQCPAMAQGAAFAAKARLRAGNRMPHTDMACHILCDTSPEAAAQVTDDARSEIEARMNADGDIADGAPDSAPAYEHWRQRIQARFGGDHRSS